MGARISLADHLSSEALRRRYLSCTEHVERTRWHGLWLLSQGRHSSEVAALLGHTPKWVRRVAGRYNRGGPAAVADARHGNRGHAPLLNAAQSEALVQALQGSASDGTPWSGPKVAQWMAQQLGRPIHPQRGWEYLRRTGPTPQRPRPRHQEADAEAQACFPAGPAAHP
jgi:transposase